MTASSSTPATGAAQHSSVIPSEVGWQFVPQYYTFVNKEPHRLHCFYNKNSTFIHGTEGEDMKPCFGQQEIHNKITSIGFEDCKVFIHSVDAQSSANGGIIIQVIGEMSNHAEPWRKFVQTFFLAEQPNGYFVLNDIFRFLKEETVESDDASETADAVDAGPVPVAAPQPEVVLPVTTAPEPAPVYEPVREPTPPPAPVVAPEPAPEPVPEPEAVITQTPTPAPEQQLPLPVQTNGIHTPEPEPAAPAAAAAAPSPVPTPAPAAPSQAVPAPAPEPAAAPAPAPAAASAPPQAAPAPVAPQPAAPSGPRTWASLAASNPKKWGAAVAQESRGTTETLASNPTSNSAAHTPSATPAPAAAAAPRPQAHQQGGQQHPAYISAQSVTTAHCFVKGVTEPLSQPALQAGLSSRFGPIKELEIVRAKACAFLEFTTVEAARRAIIASLSQHQGGDGGVWIEVGGDVGQVRISVETKKERGERPVSRPRGGAPQANGDGGAGRGQGGFRGRGGPGRGRGAPPGQAPK
ncbi:hypothetical protein HYPSUDRAFT_40269 [Hypholoma sublateritium FD-334 SS-4]|uniref:NTF2 domain-containing protein n=1 Tax=Hypholoma sublateritium (strain FD-334 SS-4) TaxID=945553 RepID=A0A0D2MHJ8_HYPSF|nr:hypothetical protein HYPSUDRAFT_40269 [Hypholoma sublateritium FD-334 SS-4]